MKHAVAVVLFIAAFFAVAPIAACSSQSSPSSDPAADAAPPSVAAGTSYTLTYGPVMAQPGEERTQCMVLRLGNLLPAHVGTIHNVLSQGSHHMIVYQTTDTVEKTTPFDCQAFTDTLDPSKGSTLMVTQKHDDILQLPAGVAFTLDTNQMMRLEVHYINASSAPMAITATATFTAMDAAQFKDEAGFLFIGDPDITLMPNSKSTLGPIFFALPAEYDGVNFFAITGHEHQFGTNVKVSVLQNKTDTGKPVYDVPGWLWSEPKTVVQDPPFTVPSGGGFQFSCDWNNTSADKIRFGESANDEMCFFWAYYYPSQGSRVCIHTASQGGVDVCCPSPNLICDIVIGYLNDAGAN